jgi:uncharacterized membrane protein YcaP (DUF421 family)
MDEMLGIALRASVMYLYALVTLRLSGKTAVGDLTPMDFVVATTIGDLFDDVFWAEVPVAQGLVAFGTVILTHLLVGYASWKKPAINRLVASRPTVVVRYGSFVAEGLHHERTRPEEVLAALRLQGEDRVGEVRFASWEPGGELSVLKREEFEPADRRDEPALAKGLR